MSVVTHIILHCSYGEDYKETARNGVTSRAERKYDGVEALNEWMNTPPRQWGDLCFVNPHAGGTQIFSGAIFMGAFNYFDLEAFIEQLTAFKWREPKKLQVFVREDEDDTFWEAEVFEEEERILAVDYESGIAPLGYTCVRCMRHGCKLWREPHILATPAPLLCVDCTIEEMEAEDISVGEDGRHDNGFGMSDQIGRMLPAVPFEEGTAFWPYTSVPEAGVAWWHGLPLRTEKPEEDEEE